MLYSETMVLIPCGRFWSYTCFSIPSPLSLSTAVLYLTKFLLILTLMIYLDIQREKASEEEPEIDPDVAAMMGFGGFKTSKK